MAGPSCAGCNVVLISLDTLRADHLGLYGYERDTSPNLDRIGADSFVFERAYAQASWTLPSHMSLLTGLYPSRHGVVHTKASLADGIPTLAEFLRARGYRTAAFTGGGYLRQRWGYEGFGTYRSRSGNRTDWAQEWASAREALDWVAASDAPFFLFWHTYGTHAPYIPEARFDLFSDPDYSGPIRPYPGDAAGQCGPDPDKECVRKQSNYYGRLRRTGVMGPEDFAYVVAKYDGEIREVDAIVGSIWETLEALGRSDSTVIVVVADHGESFQPKGSGRDFGHPNPYWENIHIPWILHVPGASGRRIEPIVESIDVMPTISSIIGVETPPGIDGEDVLRPQAASAEPRFAISEFWRAEGKELSAISVVRGRWHLIDWSEGEGTADQLFDVASDPEETVDLSDERPQMVRELKQLAAAWAREMARGPTMRGEKLELDQETRQELEALGYL